MMRARLMIAAALTTVTLSAAAAVAQTGTLPQPTPLPPPIEAARDVPFAAPIGLSIDATDIRRRVFTVRERIPVSRSGPITLLYPKWLPGTHAPSGTIGQLAGLEIFANGRRVEWTRDPVELFAFHLVVPQGATALDVQLQAITPQSGDVVMSQEMLVLDWNSVLVYPAGYFARDIVFQPNVDLPADWRFASALDGANRNGNTVRFADVSLETLVDSPLIAGRHFRTLTLSEAPAPVRLNLVADEEKDLAVSGAQLQAMKALPQQAYLLFASHHFDHYDALFWLSHDLGMKGLEHQRSSEDGMDEGYFTDGPGHIWIADLLAHEFTHSWNGKYRRPADLWTPGFEVPMRTSLLWVYEGQTQYWGQILATRSGMMTRQTALDQLAQTAAMVQAEKGREWRSVSDTTNWPIFNEKRQPPWPDWQRSGDYYLEGQLIWLDVDTLIREKSGHTKSLDDFARLFFGEAGDAVATRTYGFNDVITTLNRVAPYDWAQFLQSRIDGHGPDAPLDGLKRGGYRLAFTNTPTEFYKACEARDRVADLSYSLGLTIAPGGQIRSVTWHGVADQAGLAASSTILAVNGETFKTARLTEAVERAKSSGRIDLTIKTGEDVSPVTIRYRGGLRYPRLERIAGTPDLIGDIYSPLSAPTQH